MNRYSVSRKKVFPEKATCLNCKNVFEFYKTSSTGKYCSNKCCGEYTRKVVSAERVLKGEAGIRVLKTYLVEQRGYQCEGCGLLDWLDKPISLHIDHIDGNSDNNTIENTRLLCPNCHSQTETWCGRNKKDTKRNNYLRAYKKTLTIDQ